MGHEAFNGHATHPANRLLDRIIAAIALGARRGLASGGIALVSLLTHSNDGGTDNG
jgi:hypothetical protein